MNDAPKTAVAPEAKEPVAAQEQKQSIVTPTPVTPVPTADKK